MSIETFSKYDARPNMTDYIFDEAFKKLNSTTIGPSRLSDVFPNRGIDENVVAIMRLGGQGCGTTLIDVLHDKRRGWSIRGENVDYSANLTDDYPHVVGSDSVGGGVFPDTVSREHCAFLPRPDGTLSIFDMGSSYTTELIYGGEHYFDTYPENVNWSSGVAERMPYGELRHIANDQLGVFGVFGGESKENAARRRLLTNTMLPFYSLAEVSRRTAPGEAYKWICERLERVSAKMFYDLPELSSQDESCVVGRIVESKHGKNIVWVSMGKIGLYLASGKGEAFLRGDGGGVMAVESGDRLVFGLPEQDQEMPKELRSIVMDAGSPQEVAETLVKEQKYSDPVVTVFVD